VFEDRKRRKKDEKGEATEMEEKTQEAASSSVNKKRTFLEDCEEKYKRAKGSEEEEEKQEDDVEKEMLEALKEQEDDVEKEMLDALKEYEEERSEKRKEEGKGEEEGDGKRRREELARDIQMLRRCDGEEAVEICEIVDEMMQGLVAAVENKEEEEEEPPYPLERSWEEDDEEAWDDVNGGSLPVEEVRRARREEIEFMMKKPMWEIRMREECYEMTGTKPVSVKWVDTDKGADKGKQDIRCRLVARDFKGKDNDRDDLFALVRAFVCVHPLY
jgi:hypothetical protein